MSLWRQLRRGTRALFHRTAADQDVSDELAHYLDEAAASHIARGLTREEAVRAVRLEMGSATSVRQQVREAGWEHLVETMLADLRHGLRRLRAGPAFTGMVVLTLAAGIGGTTAIFSAVRPVLLEPLPYPDPRRLTTIVEINSDGSRNDGTFGMYHALAERSRSFEAIAVHRSWQPTMTSAEQPERFDGQRVSASYFRVLGVTPALGQSFAPDDDREGGPTVVLLSDALWRRRFGGDPAVIGRQVMLDGVSHTVLGVMPSSFENLLAPSAQLWAPLQYDLLQDRAWGHHLRTVGRLVPGVGAAAASNELSALARTVLAEQRPQSYGPQVAIVAIPLREEITRAVRPALRAIVGGVLLLLVIACLNVTNLLLARGTQRRSEFALRTALGAARGRLTRQLVTESLLLATLAGALGAGIAVLLVRVLIRLSPANLPRATAITVDGTALVFCTAVTALIGVVVGILPALQAAHNDPQQALQGGSSRLAGGRHRVRGALVVSEVAIALVLLISSGLLLRSLNRLFAVDTGFDASRLVTMQVQTSGPAFQSDSATDRFFVQALEAIRQVPGVTGAALTSQLPLSGDRDEYGVRFEADQHGFSSYRYAVSPGYVETMGIPIRDGRSLDDRDRDGAPRVALISESLARRRFPSEGAIGKKLSIGPIEGFTIVGVVGDVRHASLALDPSDAVYVTTAQWPFPDRSMSVVARTTGALSSWVPSLRDAVSSVNKDQPVVRAATMDALLAASTAERRFTLMVFEAFGVTALILAVAGIFSVVSGSVAERTREFGLRSALGASRASILTMVVRQGLLLAQIGIAIGLIVSLAAGRAIAALLFGITTMDALTYVVVITALLTASVLASWLPARRASRLDPAQTLRAE